MKMDILGLLDKVVLHLFFYLVLTTSLCATNEIVDSPLLKEIELKKALFYNRNPTIFNPVAETVHKMLAKKKANDGKIGFSNFKSHIPYNGFDRYPQVSRQRPFSHESYPSVNDGETLRIPILQSEFSTNHDNDDYHEGDEEDTVNTVADNNEQSGYEPEPHHLIFSRKSASYSSNFEKGTTKLGKSKNTEISPKLKTKHKTRYRPVDSEHVFNEDCDCNNGRENSLRPYLRRKSSVSVCPCAKSNYKSKIKSYTSESDSINFNKYQHERPILKPCRLKHNHAKFNPVSSRFPPLYSVHSKKRKPVRYLMTEVESNTETDENYNHDNDDDDEPFTYQHKIVKPQKSTSQPVTSQPVTAPPPAQVTKELQASPSTVQNSLLYVLSPQGVPQTPTTASIPVPVSLPYVMESQQSAQILNTQLPTIAYNLDLTSKMIQHVPPTQQLVSSPQYVAANMPLGISQSPAITPIMPPQPQSVILVNNSPPPPPIVYSSPEVQQPSYAINHQPVVLQNNPYNYQTQPIAETSIPTVSYITPDGRPLISTLSTQPSLLLSSYGNLHQQKIEKPEMDPIIPKQYVILKKPVVYHGQDVDTVYKQPLGENIRPPPDYSPYQKNSPPPPDVVHISYNRKLENQKIDDSKPLLFASNYYMQEKITSDLTAKSKQKAVNSFA